MGTVPGDQKPAEKADKIAKFQLNTPPAAILCHPLEKYILKVFRNRQKKLTTFQNSKDTPSSLQKLLSFRYQKPNQIPIEGTVSNPEFEPNQISATRNQSRMRTGQASILVKVIKMSKYWRKTSKNKGSGVNLGCPCQGQYDYLLVRAI